MRFRKFRTCCWFISGWVLESLQWLPAIWMNARQVLAVETERGKDPWYVGIRPLHRRYACLIDGDSLGQHRCWLARFWAVTRTIRRFLVGSY